MLNGGPFTGYVGDDLLYPIADVLSPETLNDFTPSFIENASVDGTQYGAPMIASARALFMNTDLMEQAGLTEAPTTWEELKEASQKVSETGVAGYGMPLGSEEAQAEAATWFYGGGGGFGNASEITVDTPENLEAAEFMRSMIDDGDTQPDPGATNRSPLMDVFIQGEIGFQVGLPPTVGQIEESNPDLNYEIAPIPTKDGSSFTLGVADHLMAFRNDDDKAEAIKAFLD
ncbi:ABC transporter substrate-binding protein [Naumannella halotolerans]|uniref:ABC transporter substrate-binding protein n=1 Tax=Naumannella halotolerans TaxID=993414 RepID=UPI00370D0249